MTHQEKLDWMAIWCANHGVALELKGECGIGRECVGIVTQGKFPDYEWYDENGDWSRIDKNGNVWTPENVYYKHPCVAVLGRGEVAEAELYDWLKWFDENGFVVEYGMVSPGKRLSIVEVMLGKHIFVRMVKKERALQPEA